MSSSSSLVCCILSLVLFFSLLLCSLSVRESDDPTWLNDHLASISSDLVDDLLLLSLVFAVERLKVLLVDEERHDLMAAGMETKFN